MSDGRVRTLLTRGGAVALSWTTGATTRRTPFAVEDAAVEKAVDSRRREFFTGRTCARAALVALGRSPVALPQAGRRPVWPAGVVGSITHTRGFIGATVARTDAVAGIGLDAESGLIRDRGVLEAVLTDEELLDLEALPPAERHVAATLSFSAKEAFYKALPWDLAEGVDFRDVRVGRHGLTSTFSPTPGASLGEDPRVPRAGLCAGGPNLVLNLVLRMPLPSAPVRP
jgi:4'-phosphopantetheinyl transferase EntD